MYTRKEEKIDNNKSKNVDDSGKIVTPDEGISCSLEPRIAPPIERLLDAIPAGSIAWREIFLKAKPANPEDDDQDSDLDDSAEDKMSPRPGR